MGNAKCIRCVISVATKSICVTKFISAKAAFPQHIGKLNAIALAVVSVAAEID